MRRHSSSAFNFRLIRLLKAESDDFPLRRAECCFLSSYHRIRSAQFAVSWDTQRRYNSVAPTFGEGKTHPPVDSSSLANPAIREIAEAIHRKGGRIPLVSILPLVGAKTKDAIFRSGKGIEGFVRTGEPAVFVVEDKGMRYAVSNLQNSETPVITPPGSEVSSPVALRELPDSSVRVKPVAAEHSSAGVGSPTHPRPVTQKPMPFARIEPSSSNNWGGWGGQFNVPTAEDVYEILKYVPVHWGNLGALNVPPTVKKKHVRISSFLQWLRRQPKYFEVRNVAGTLEVRRAVTLHPEQHGKTYDEAVRWLSDRVASGEHNAIVSATDSLGTNSQAATAIYKFLVRVVPGYFVAPELVLMRYTKKGLSVVEIAQAVKEHPNIFESIHSHEGHNLIRRRTGADSSKWRDDFYADYTSTKDDIPGLFTLLGRSSVCWDRPEYLYVRLLDSEKIAVGGYDGMLALMRRHPGVFKMGEIFFRRVDHSDPAADDSEPQPNEEGTYRRAEENVYHGHRDIATIFHYISPDDGFVNVSQLSECASPAISVELPPRIVSVLQMFPDLFHCKETSPGIFTIRKVVCKSPAVGATASDTVSQKRPVQYGSGFFRSTGVTHDSSSRMSNASPPVDLDDMMMGEDDCDTLTRRETVDAIKVLVPSRGVEMNQLSQWLSMDARKGIKAHFETLQGLVDFNSNVFKYDPATGIVTVLAADTKVK